MRVAVRPAKPLMFATIRGVPVLGLPGNPASAFVSYHLFARPCSTGSPATGRRVTADVLRAAAVDLPRRGRTPARGPGGRQHHRRTAPVRPVGTSDRHHLAATAAANAHAHLPDGPTVRAGELVDCSWMCRA